MLGPFFIFTLFFLASLSPSVEATPTQGHYPGSWLLPPPHYGVIRAFMLSPEDFDPFFPPRRLASNCAYPRC